VAHTRLLIGRGQTAAGGPRRSPSIDLRAVTGDSRRPGSQKEQDRHRWPSPSPRQSWLTGGPRFPGSASHHMTVVPRLQRVQQNGTTEWTDTSLSIRSTSQFTCTCILQQQQFTVLQDGSYFFYEDRWQLITALLPSTRSRLWRIEVSLSDAKSKNRHQFSTNQKKIKSQMRESLLKW